MSNPSNSNATTATTETSTPAAAQSATTASATPVAAKKPPPPRPAGKATPPPEVQSAGERKAETTPEAKPKTEVAEPPPITKPDTNAQVVGGEDTGVEVVGKADALIEEKPSPREVAAKNMAALAVVEPAAASQHVECPTVGAKLRCDAFEGDTSVVCVVESVNKEHGLFVVRIPALGDRRWPFSADRLVGNALMYVPSDYPAFGADANFDEKFRAHLKGRELTNRERGLLARSAFTPPRKARTGYTWVMVVVGPVSATAYNFDGKLVKADHPVSRVPQDAYLEMFRSTAAPLIREGILTDFGPG